MRRLSATVTLTEGLAPVFIGARTFNRPRRKKKKQFILATLSWVAIIVYCEILLNGIAARDASLVLVLKDAL